MPDRGAHLADREAELLALASQTEQRLDHAEPFRLHACFRRLGRDRGAKHRVGQILRQPLPFQERQRGLVEVARAPAEQRRVERHHDRPAAAGFRARHQRAHETVVARPVELEPARCRPHRGRRLLHRHRRLVRKDVADPFGGRRARHREIGLGMHHLQHADRREQHRCHVSSAEQLDREVAHRDVVEHARHETVPVEGGAVGAHRRLHPRPADDVGRGLRAHRGRRLRLQRVRRHRHARLSPAHARNVNLHLPQAAGRRRRCGHGCGVRAEGRTTSSARSRRGSPPSPP